MDSYSNILDRMVQRYEQLTGFVPNDESDIMLRFKVLAGEILNCVVATEFLEQQMFSSSASGSYLDEHAKQRGLERKKAVKSKGEVTFYVASPSQSDIIIEAGTVVSTNEESAREFETTETVVLKAGNMSVKANVSAIKAGADSNVLKDQVCVMVTPPVGITRVNNDKKFSLGVDEETDEELRKRIIDSYRDISNSTNEIYYKRLVESVPGVYSSSVIPHRRGAGTIDIIICGKGDNAVTINQIEQAQKLVDENREICVDASVLYSIPVDVRFVLGLEVENGFSFESVSENVREKLTTYIDSLGVGKPALLSDLSDIVYHTQGVKNYFFYDDLCSDVTVRDSEHCVTDSIDIRQV